MSVADVRAYGANQRGDVVHEAVGEALAARKVQPGGHEEVVRHALGLRMGRRRGGLGWRTGGERVEIEGRLRGEQVEIEGNEKSPTTNLNGKCSVFSDEDFIQSDSDTGY